MTFEKKNPTMNFSNSKTSYKVDNEPEEQHTDKIQESQRENEKEQQTELKNNTDNTKLNDLLVLTNTLKSKIDELKQKNDEFKQKNDELEKKLLYLAAEYENNKKRNKLDLENTTKFAISKFALDAVNIYDVLQTALQNIDPEKTDKILSDGVKMTINEFNKMFDRINIVKIEPEVGSVFDHNKHEAISRAESELEIGCIVKVVRPGYELHGRLLRPAMVIVSSGKE